MKNPIFCDITSCCLGEVNQPFGGTYHPPLSSQLKSKPKQEISMKKASKHQLAFLGMLYNFLWAFEGTFDSANAFFLLVCVNKNTGRHLMHTGKLAKSQKCHIC
jgi:hypothetical protein